MAVISEDFVRCHVCGYAEFDKKEVVTIPKNVKRDDKKNAYPVLESEIRYYCGACKTEKE